MNGKPWQCYSVGHSAWATPVCSFPDLARTQYGKYRSIPSPKPAEINTDLEFNTDDLVEALTYPHVHPPTSLSKLHYLLTLLQSHDKRTYLTSLLRVLSRKHLTSAASSSEFDPKWWVEDVPKISQIAGLLNDIIGSNEDFRDLAVDWLVSPNGGGVGEPIGIRRALVCVLSKDEVMLKGMLEKSLGQFGDKIWIRHTPIMRQEGWFFFNPLLFLRGFQKLAYPSRDITRFLVPSQISPHMYPLLQQIYSLFSKVNAQLLLLSAGYVHRLVPQFLHRLARSSLFLNGVSNRIGTSSTRARFLGMIVGETLSEMTDKDGKPMKFGVEDTETEEAKWWKSIRHVEDTVGTVEGLEAVGREVVVRKKKKETQTQTRTSKVMVIEEIEDDDDDEEDELMPYAKPDSDAEDSDDDPTLINRKKDSAPVYVEIPIMINHSSVNHTTATSATYFSTFAQRTPMTANFWPSNRLPPSSGVRQRSEKKSPTTRPNSPPYSQD